MALQETNNQHNLPAGLSQPALRALSAAGYTRLDQLTTVKEAELLQLHGMGPKAISLLRSALEERGLSFANPGSRGTSGGNPGARSRPDTSTRE